MYLIPGPIFLTSKRTERMGRTLLDGKKRIFMTYWMRIGEMSEEGTSRMGKKMDYILGGMRRDRKEGKELTRMEKKLSDYGRCGRVNEWTEERRRQYQGGKHYGRCINGMDRKNGKERQGMGKTID
jgi:hypothetical protein